MEERKQQWVIPNTGYQTGGDLLAAKLLKLKPEKVVTSCRVYPFEGSDNLLSMSGEAFWCGKLITWASGGGYYSNPKEGTVDINGGPPEFYLDLWEEGDDPYEWRIIKSVWYGGVDWKKVYHPIPEDSICSGAAICTFQDKLEVVKASPVITVPKRDRFGAVRYPQLRLSEITSKYYKEIQNG